MRPDRSRLLATAALVSVTAVWGSTFFLIHSLVETIPSSDFLAVRFAIAALALVPLAWRKVRAMPVRLLRLGVWLGLLYGGAQILQTVGLTMLSASVSGFVTGTYVVLTPVFGLLLFRDRVGPLTWVAVLLATAGLAVLSLRGTIVGAGTLVTLASAVLYAMHIATLGQIRRPEHALGLSAVQTLVIAVVTLVAALPGGIVLPSGAGQWWSVVYMALIAGVLALVSQTWAQSHMSATRAAIIMTLEPVFATLFAVLFGGDSLTTRMLLGGVLVLAAMYLVELVPAKPADQLIEARHHEV